VNLAAPVLRRFPLIARPRPVCGPLAVRIGDLSRRAEVADRDNDLGQAAAVHNLAALILSDCGLPEQARDLCHRHTLAYAGAAPSARLARLALEPLVNLARLHIRDGHGEVAFALLDALYTTVQARTDTIIDSMPIEASALTATPNDHREVVKWLWSVHLAEGSRALAAAGRWDDAARHLQRHNGIGNQMLDGRQIAVLSHALNHDTVEVTTLLDQTEPGEPWQNAVTATLRVLCSHAPTPEQVHSTISQYQHLTYSPNTALFGTRLGLCVADAAIQNLSAAADQVIAAVIDHTVAARDGYATRDLLNHSACARLVQRHQQPTLDAVLTASGLDEGPPPRNQVAELDRAVALADAALARLVRPIPAAALGQSPSSRYR